jgi:hypothetical protein
MPTTLLTVHDLRLLLAEEDDGVTLDFNKEKCCEDCQMPMSSFEWHTLSTIREDDEVDDSDSNHKEQT